LNSGTYFKADFGQHFGEEDTSLRALSRFDSQLAAFQRDLAAKRDQLDKDGLKDLIWGCNWEGRSRAWLGEMVNEDTLSWLGLD
jgi:hypothetical protein